MKKVLVDDKVFGFYSNINIDSFNNKINKNISFSSDDMNFENIKELSLEKLLDFFLFHNESFSNEQIDYFLHYFCYRTEFTNSIFIKKYDIENHKAIKIIWDIFMNNFKKLDNMNDYNLYLYILYIYHTKFCLNKNDFLTRYLSKNEKDYFLFSTIKLMQTSLNDIDLGLLIHILSIISYFKDLNTYIFLKDRVDEISKIPYWTMRRIFLRIIKDKKANKNLRGFINLILLPILNELNVLNIQEKSYLALNLLQISKRVVLMVDCSNLLQQIFEETFIYLEQLTDDQLINDNENLKIFKNFLKIMEINKNYDSDRFKVLIVRFFSKINENSNGNYEKMTLLNEQPIDKSESNNIRNERIFSYKNQNDQNPQEKIEHIFNEIEEVNEFDINVRVFKDTFIKEEEFLDYEFKEVNEYASLENEKLLNENKFLSNTQNFKINEDQKKNSMEKFQNLMDTTFQEREEEIKNIDNDIKNLFQNNLNENFSINIENEKIDYNYLLSQGFNEEISKIPNNENKENESIIKKDEQDFLDETDKFHEYIKNYRYLILISYLIKIENKEISSDKELINLMLKVHIKALKNLKLDRVEEKVFINFGFCVFNVMLKNQISDKELFIYMTSNFIENITNNIIFQSYIDFLLWTKEYLSEKERNQFLMDITRTLINLLKDDFNLYKFMRVVCVLSLTFGKRTVLTDNMHFELILILEKIEDKLILISMFIDFVRSLYDYLDPEYRRNLLSFFLNKIKIKNILEINQLSFITKFYLNLQYLKFSDFHPIKDQEIIEKINTFLLFIESTTTFKYQINLFIKILYRVLEEYNSYLHRFNRPVLDLLEKIEIMIKRDQVLITNEIDRYILYIMVMFDKNDKEFKEIIIKKCVDIIDLVYEKRKTTINMNMLEIISAMKVCFDHGLISKNLTKNFLVNVQIFKKLKDYEHLKLDDQAEYDINLINMKFQNIYCYKDSINEFLINLERRNLISKQLKDLSMIYD